MSVNERNIILDPPFKEDLGANGGLIEWGSIAVVNDWVAVEADFWSRVFHVGVQEEIKAVFGIKSSQFETLYSQAVMVQTSNFTEVKSQEDCVALIRHLRSWDFISSRLLGFLYSDVQYRIPFHGRVEISNHGRIAFDIICILAVRSNRLKMHPTNHSAIYTQIIGNAARLISRIEAIQQNKRIIEESVNEHFESAASKVRFTLDQYGVDKNFLEGLKGLQEDRQEWTESLEKGKLSVEQLEIRIQSFDSLIKDNLENISNDIASTEDNYKKAIAEAAEAQGTRGAIEKTADLWIGRASKAQKAFWFSVAGLLIVVGGTLWGGYGYRAEILSLMSQELKLNAFTFIFAAVILGLFAVALRLLSRSIVMFLRQWQDANERVATIETFIRLQEKSLLTGNTDRDYLLNAITRPGPDIDADRDTNLGALDMVAKALQRKE